LAANATSTCWASVADNWFFAGKRRWAHGAASPAVIRPSISRSNSPLKLTDKAAESSEFGEGELNLFVLASANARQPWLQQVLALC
jgi:hypothetical protein